MTTRPVGRVWSASCRGSGLGLALVPGELGLQYVSEVERQLPWGADVARSPMTPASDGGYSAGNANGGGGGSGGGGGGGGGGNVGGGTRWRDVARLISRF